MVGIIQSHPLLNGPTPRVYYAQAFHDICHRPPNKLISFYTIASLFPTNSLSRQVGNFARVFIPVNMTKSAKNVTVIEGELTRVYEGKRTE